ncbi:MAG: DUF5666 domain-containing protein [Ignavibacteriaceae bacterium]|nr:DUF5666 domain-containing protein [Ignavibacteriaceae bacterium]
MKYKKHIATGALAISLLVSGSSVFAETTQDLGIKSVQQTYQKQNKENRNLRVKNKRRNSIVGIVSAINNASFTVEIKNMRKKSMLSADIETDSNTIYKKNGVVVSKSDLAVGQKVVIAGNLDKVTNILNAKMVKIVAEKNKNL